MVEGIGGLEEAPYTEPTDVKKLKKKKRGKKGTVT